MNGIDFLLFVLFANLYPDKLTIAKINKKPILIKLSLTDDDEALLGNALLIDKIVQLNFKDNTIEILTE